MQNNAYFQLSIEEDGSYLVLYPRAKSGDVLSVAEIEQYMGRIDPGILASEELATELAGALAAQHKINRVKISDELIKPVSETVTASISEDKMKAFARFYPASEDGKTLSKTDIIQMLGSVGIRYGIDEECIERWLENKYYCTDILIARGLHPEESVDAVIEYKFETQEEFRPTIEEDGSVNFHELNLLNDIAAGDLLAVLTPAHRGENGMNVLGHVLTSRNPVRKTLKHSKNAVLSEDGCELKAETGGYVELVGEKVTVHNMYVIKGNVGTATGDVDFDGIVKISGDVLTGYAVRAAVDIIVQGVVEGASLTAGRDIAIGSGVHGMSKADINAGGNVTANFIKDSSVNAGGSVKAGSILFCKVTAKDSILVNTGKGLVKGGELRAGALISAKTVGSALTGGYANLVVGTDPDDITLFRELESSLAEKRAEYDKLHQTLSFLKKKAETLDAIKAEHQKLLKVLPYMIEKQREEIEDMFDTFSKLKAGFEKNNTGKVEIEGTIYEGSSIVVSNTTYYMNEDLAQCQFTKKGSEIVVSSL